MFSLPLPVHLPGVETIGELALVLAALMLAALFTGAVRYVLVTLAFVA